MKTLTEAHDANAPEPVLDRETEKYQTCKSCGGGTSNSDIVFGHVCPEGALSCAA